MKFLLQIVGKRSIFSFSLSLLSMILLNFEEVLILLPNFQLRTYLLNFDQTEYRYDGNSSTRMLRFVDSTLYLVVSQNCLN